MLKPLFFRTITNLNTALHLIMKTYLLPFLAILRSVFYSVLCASWLLLSGCDKEINQPQMDLPALVPVSQEANAGTWKTAVLLKSNEVTLTAPAATSSPEYLAELQSLKGMQSQRTSEQEAAIQYWSGGGVLRWNQIMRELVAKYNLPPFQNSDGTYPVPDANNPFSYPQFPFSNPPYAARAYGYVSIAQYDALVAAWHYKYQYNRPAPYTIDASIKPRVAASALPSYPSEDAVLAAVTLEMMKFLFPAEVEFLTKKAEEQKNARLWAGANVASDIAAGEALGKMVAQKVLARAKTDGMKNAVGNQAMWEELATAAVNRGEIPWISQETPRRPPMLPGFGKVLPCLFDASQVAALRPPPPPSTASELMKKELEEVKFYSQNVTRDRLRIIHFWADGVGTATPPGHWNQIATDLIIPQQWSEVRTARTFALLNMALMDAAICCWDTKNYYFNPRPSQLDPAIKTSTGLPNFPSYTSGHSTFSGAASTVLKHLFPTQGESLEAMAQEASMSRLYGAIHYRSDCEAGLKCGKAIGDFAVKRAQTDGGQ